MPVRVWLPPLLRERGNAEEIIGEGNTLADVLGGLGNVGEAIMAGSDRVGFRVYLNGAPTENWEAGVSAGDELVILPPIRGGR